MIKKNSCNLSNFANLIMSSPDINVGEKTEPGDHPIFTKDPLQWMDFVHKHVCVTTEDGNEHTGWVYTIDPVSESVVLLDNVTLGDPLVSMQILIGSSVSKVEILSTTPPEDMKDACDRLFRPAIESSLSEEDVLKRRSDLKSWLEKHRIPVCIGGYDSQSLSVLSGVLIIQPPFTEDSCLSTNEIILSKVQGLVKAMPKSS